MRKLTRSSLVGLALACSLMTLSSSTFASNTIIVNGSTITGTQSSYVTNGTTMAPMRAVSEALGASINYDAKTKKITIANSDTKIILTVGKYQATVNGETVVLAVAPVIKNGTTMVPLRFVSQSFGCDVGYNSKTGVITITGGSSTSKPNNGTNTNTSANKDQFGNTIRTTNLPNNAARFPYVQQDVPNWAYEQQPWDDNYWGPYYRSDKLEGASKVSQFPNQVYAEGSTLASVIKDNYETIDNFIKAQICVDYRTIDKETYSSAIANGLALNTTTFKTFEDMKKQAASYVDYVKEKKVIIESEYKILPETAWVSIGDQVGIINFSVYAKVTPKSVTGASFDSWGSMSVFSSKFKVSDIQKNYTYEGILTYTLIRQQDGTWKLNNNTTSVWGQLAPSCDMLNGVSPAQKKLTTREDKFNYTWTRDKSTYYTRYAKDVKAGF